MNGPADELTVPCEGAGVWPGAAITLWTDDGKRGREGVAIRPTPEGRWVVWLAECGGYPPQMDLLWPCLMCLDLADRPTRLEAMARLAQHIGDDWRGGWRRLHDGVWKLGHTLFSADRTKLGGGDFLVEGLAGLDLADDVDTRALAIVLRQVFGGAR